MLLSEMVIQYMYCYAQDLQYLIYIPGTKINHSSSTEDTYHLKVNRNKKTQICKKKKLFLIYVQTLEEGSCNNLQKFTSGLTISCLVKYLRN